MAQQCCERTSDKKYSWLKSAFPVPHDIFHKKKEILLQKISIIKTPGTEYQHKADAQLWFCMDSSRRLWGSVLQGVVIRKDKSSEDVFPRLEQYFHFCPCPLRLSGKPMGRPPTSSTREGGWPRGFCGFWWEFTVKSHQQFLL